MKDFLDGIITSTINVTSVRHDNNEMLYSAPNFSFANHK